MPSVPRLTPLLSSSLLLHLQYAHVVAVQCGKRGVAVCAVRTDLKIRTKADREYVVYGCELVTDPGYLGANKKAVLPAMLRRSQLLQTVLAHNPQAYVVSDWPGCRGSTLRECVA